MRLQHNIKKFYAATFFIMAKKFLISHRKELLITYPCNYGERINKEIIYNFLINLKNKKNENYFDKILVGEEKGKKKERQHWHCWVHSNLKDGINTRNERFFDIPFGETIQWTIATGETKLITGAHPNIRFKGDKSVNYCKDTKGMIQYCTKEDQEPTSNFNWKSFMENVNNEHKQSKKEKLEMEFTKFLKTEIESGLTKEDLIKKIYKNDDYFYIYSSKYLNYSKFINEEFKKNTSSKPVPNYGKYWLPKDLITYLKYLDNYIKLWNQFLISDIEKTKNFHDSWANFVKLNPERPMSLYIQGDACCGKTSLISCFKDFSYWCNGWNYENYEQRRSFNFFDDYDGTSGAGNWEATDFVYLKPWLGCQQVISISGKYKMPKTIENHKPCVFISNKKKEQRFPNESDRNYLDQFGMKYIEIPTNQKLWEKPKKNSINTFLEWEWFDTKETWVYKNLVNPQPEPIQEEAGTSGQNYDIIEISSSPVQPVDLTDEQDNTVILIKDDPEAEIIEELEYDENLFNESSVGRPKRSFGFISDFFDLSKRRNKKRKGKSPARD